MTREQADRMPAALAALLFFPRRAPMLGLSPAEQQLLLLALRNVSDADCAILLGLSPHTVKMRWRQVFERIGERRPELLGPGGLPGPDDGLRGPEKRRHLLAYLRQHMEELRPREGPTPAAKTNGSDA
jgi:DNA-binding NarL/FixJ family response regulator